MPTPKLSPELMREAVEAFEAHDRVATEAAKFLGLAPQTFRNRLKKAEEEGITAIPLEPGPGFEIEPLPDQLPTAKELRERRKKEYARVKAAKDARHLIDVKVKIDGPIGIAHIGDPHVDDKGQDMEELERDVDCIARTEGLFGGNIGDLQNNWVGRLGRLYGEQSLSHHEAWILTEWLVNAVDWLYLVKGNHDVWSGAGDPLDWMARNMTGHMQAHGARLNLVFPNGKQVRVNARHDFQGHSMWNEVHGPKKAVKMGWRDHILTCGHKHTSGYAVDKCPASGLVSHIIRCAGYKVVDTYAEQLGLPDQNIFPSCVTIIDPEQADDSRKLIQTFFDVEQGAEFLTWLRARA